MVRTLIRIVACLLLLGGFMVLAYPHIEQRRYTESANDVIDVYDSHIEILREQAEESPQEQAEQTEDTPAYLSDFYEQTQVYNEDLYQNGQEGFKDAWSYEPASFDLSKWGLDENVVGYLDIPRMNVRLPIYLGATVENMKKGAVHLTETSLPIGGENTNCVLAAHRGYAKAAMFRDIETMCIGDQITITNLWETLTYEVVETKVIDPNAVSEVLIQPGRDLVTLITCHPYRRNYQRYVVYCERVVTEDQG